MASVRQAFAEAFDQQARVLGGLIGQVEVDHRGIDVLMAEEVLDLVQACSGLHQVRGEGMTQGVGG